MERDAHLLPEEIITSDKFRKVKKFIEEKQTPFLVMDLDKLKEKYQELIKHLSFAKVYYAMKANPMDEVIMLLNELGANFDASSRYEIEQLLRLGISPDRISFGNTIKRAKDIQYAHKVGIRLFTTDCEMDLENIGKYAPGSKVFFRIMTDGRGADWPLSRKFGAHPDQIYYLILKAEEMNVIPYGISFHVGSQQRDIGQWDNSIAQSYYLFHELKKKGVELKGLNIGGGFPANYLAPTPGIEVYAKEIKRFLDEDFGENMPEILIEPGRSLVGDAGIIVSEVIMVERKARLNPYRWVYLDIGMFGGLIETIDESIKYPIFVEKNGHPEEVILAGPTCDSMDVLYEKYRYKLPHTIVPGDKIYIFTTGAYTQTYSSVGFNGIPPLKAYVLN